MSNYEQILQIRAFKRELQNQPLVVACQKYVKQVREEIQTQYFNSGKNHREIAPKLVFGLAMEVDLIIETIWQRLDLHLEPLSLVAVGGYGRQELHPYSDIDLLLYHHDPIREEVTAKIQKFVQILWDSGLKGAMTIRDHKEISKNIRNDLFLVTGLLEARLLCGDINLLTDLRKTIYTSYWNTKKFFSAKKLEQAKRHTKYKNTSYHLEPDIKNSPGGLRDLHVMMWVANHLYHGINFNKLIEKGLISRSGMIKLNKARNFLWSIRIGVHLLSGRANERLLVEYQRELANKLGFKNTRGLKAVEELMQGYYRAAIVITTINDSLVRNIGGQINKPLIIKKRAINNDFYSIGDTLYCYDPRCFEHNPSNLLTCFLLLGKNPKLKKISTSCIQAIYEHLFLIDNNFLSNIKNRWLFMQIFSIPSRQADILELMQRYGVLASYLPVFGKITGLIQHDLFHIYTVDAHTIKLIYNLQALLVQNQDKDLETPAQVTRGLPSFPLVVIAGLFHDIAKGRGGDHSKLGAIDVANFAKHHEISANDTELLSWLVENHLYMSATSQKKDLADPAVIHHFGDMVSNKQRLDYLYVLTVADIIATNPSLWSSWKAALLARLYTDTLSYLEGRYTESIDSMIEDKKAKALEIIKEKDHHKAQEFWELLENDFFVNKSAENMAWQTSRVLRVRSDKSSKKVLVMIRATHQLISHGATEIAIYSPYKPMAFSDIVLILDNLNIDVQEARIHHTSDGFVFDTFIVLGENSKPLPRSSYTSTRNKLEAILVNNKNKRPKISIRYISTRLKKFWFTPRVKVIEQGKKHYYIQVECVDYQGVLATIAETFRTLNLEVVKARVNTMGEEVRDVFFVEIIKDKYNKEEIREKLVNSISQLYK